MTGRHRSRGASHIKGLHSLLGRKISPRVESLITSRTLGAGVLFFASVFALIWANSPWSESYFAFVHQTISIDIGVLKLSKNLQHWINDGLMAVFFFVVGLEIKNEIVTGELSNPKKAALPVIAACGGMIIPALIFVWFNEGTPYSTGWGIPMATDIAFALGVYGLLSRGLPSELRVFLLAVAVADDIGVVLVIALFYTDQFSTAAMALASLIFVLVLFLRGLGYRPILGYVAIGILFWVTILKSGVHATIAGVILGLLTPARPMISKVEFLGLAEKLLKNLKTDKKSSDEDEEQTFGQIEILARETESPLSRLERLLQPWNVFLVLPVFALVNAGVELDIGSIKNSLLHPVGAGVLWGLLLGKPIGIILFALLGERFGICTLPKGATWLSMIGVGCLAGIGFTVSLFVTGLAYNDYEIVSIAKVGVFAGSTISALIGIAILIIEKRKTRNQESAS